jgi:hypothetical protein
MSSSIHDSDWGYLAKRGWYRLVIGGSYSVCITKTTLEQSPVLVASRDWDRRSQEHTIVDTDPVTIYVDYDKEASCMVLDALRARCKPEFHAIPWEDPYLMDKLIVGLRYFGCAEYAQALNKRHTDVISAKAAEAQAAMDMAQDTKLIGMRLDQIETVLRNNAHL